MERTRAKRLMGAAAHRSLLKPLCAINLWLRRPEPEMPPARGVSLKILRVKIVDCPDECLKLSGSMGLFIKIVVYQVTLWY
jgi:hypothetical protein